MGTPYGGLPTELIHDIFDTLYDEQDLSTLKACSIVDRLFCTLSQMRLLSHIILQQECTYPTISPRPTVITQPYSPALHFLSVLEKSSHIATYIQCLTIQCDWMAAGIKGVEHWVRTDTSLAVLLPRLINLRRVSVSGSRVVHPQKQHTPRPWNSVSQGLTSIFSNRIPSHALTGLNITGIGRFPIILLQNCTSLKRLWFSSVSFDPERDRSEENTIPRVDFLHLEDLTDLEKLAEWFTAPSFPLNINNLRELSVHPGGHQELEEIALCSSWAKSVTELRIHTESAGVLTSYNTLNYILQHQSAPVPDLQGMDSLKCIVIVAKFTVRIFHHRSLIDYFTSPLPWITSLFTTLSKSPTVAARITHLALNFAFVKFPIELVMLLSKSWKPLAAAIDNFPRPPKLILNITGLDHNGIMELQRSEYLVGLTERGIITYT
ncbi:hypothetical protein BDN70DRAFT_936775 [Pholiota conissans]|uniref:F-box domain-containing protein n=1 Tax=Pholiota conissans TaxID=109636 RepID=A0A9P5YSH3_9AGAR|nr:hypothetical protein BDN70DRAFT_936775 [Pholiota conissans]